MFMELPNMANAIQKRNMNAQISVIVCETNLIKNEVDSKTLSQSKNFIQIIKMEKAPTILCSDLYSLPPLYRLEMVIQAVELNWNKSRMFQS